MKYLFKVLVLCGFYQLFVVSVFAQEGGRITLQVKQKEIGEIIKEIERQSGFTVTYESSLFKGVKKITFHAENELLENCLNRLFKDLPFTYTMRGQFVILKKKTEKVTVSGFVRDKTTGEPLMLASVLERFSRQGTATNEDGFFTISLQKDEIQLEISYIGFYSYRQSFRNLAKDTIIDIQLEERGHLAEVIVMGSKEAHDPVLSSQMGAMAVSQATIKAIPTLFGEADVVKTLQTLPGVSPGVEGFSGMYVRGGNGDENLFLVDGNPLYQVNHLGGLFSAFSTDAIREMEFYKGAFPSRFGGRLSSVIDISTQEGDLQKYSGSASLGLVSGSFHLNGPIVKNKTGINVSIRRSWLDALSVPALAILNAKDKDEGIKTIARYAFTDLNVRLDHHFSATDRAYVTLYWGDDLFKWGDESFLSKYEKERNYKEYFNKNTSHLRWGNLMVSTGWIHRFHPNTIADFSLVYTHYRSKLKNEIFDSYGTPGTDSYEELFSQTESENGIRDIGVKALFKYTPSSSHYIRYGATWYNHHFRPEYVKNKYSGDIEVPKDIHTNQSLKANEISVYLEDDWTVSKTIRFNGGIRMNLYTTGQKTYTSVEPRLSARFLLRTDLSMKVSYARMNQFVHQLNDSYINLPTDMWLPVSEKFKPLSSDQLAAGLYYSPLEDYSFSLEGYYKWMNNLLDYKDGYNVLPSFIGWDNKLTAGKGWSYGVELMAHKKAGKVTGWVGYGLMWADRQFDQINDGKRYPAKYDNRHKLNVVANWKLSEKVELTGSWIYMTGNRMTLSFEEYLGMGKPGSPVSGNYVIYDYPTGMEYYEGRNNFRLPDYHRMDLGINIYRPTKKGRMGIWSVSIYNVYSRFNPIIVQKDHRYSPDGLVNSDGSGSSYYIPCFKTFSFMPIIPSVSYTLKF